MKLFIEPFIIIFKNRYMLTNITISDIKAKYAGSLLGLIWMFVYPLLLLAAYSFVYIFIFQARFAQMNSLEYVLLIFSGLIPFLGFTEGLAVSIVSITANSSIVKNTMFPVEILPVKAVFFAQCTQTVGFIILTIVTAITGNISVYSFLLLPIWIFQIFFGIGLGWLFACLNIYFRDLQNLINLITLFLMMISPIAYTVDMVPAGLQPYLKINPLYYFITAYQDSLIVGCFPRDGVLWKLAVISLLVFWLGYYVFSRLKTIFVDNV